MAEADKYRFRIGAYSPKTMPLVRLLKYLAQFEKVLPHPEKVHLVGVEEGSTRPAFYIEPNYESQTVNRLGLIALGHGTADEKRAYAEIQHLAAEDEADGVDFASPNGAVIINFPKKLREEEPQQLVVEGVKQKLTIFATAFKAGRSNPKSQKYDAWFVDMKDGATIRAEMSIELGLRLGKKLEEELSVSGDAVWNRDEKGQWKIQCFSITNFEEFQPKSPADTFSDLEAIESAFPEDVQDRLKQHRGTEE